MQEFLSLRWEDAFFIIDVVILDRKVSFKSDALKKLALKYTLADLLHLTYILWQASQFLLRLIELYVFLFNLLALVVNLVLLLLKLFSLCFQIIFFLS